MTPAGRRRAWALVAVVLVGIVVAYARVRWPGYLPLGSDNDEYRLAGHALARLDPPRIAGVEGTKYPLGYPALLAVLEWLRLPPAHAALAINVLALAAAAGLVAWVAGRGDGPRAASPGAGLVAGALLLGSAAIWNDVFSVMPDLLLVAIIAAMLAVLDGPLDRRRLRALTALAVAAVLIKTLAGLLVAGLCAGLLVSARGSKARKQAALTTAQLVRPLVAATVIVVVGVVAMLPLGSHTTGYLATFPLVDPDDASRGRLGPLGLLRRTAADVPETLADFGRAIAMLGATRPVAITLALAGIAVAVAGTHALRSRGPLAPAVTGMVLAYAAGMAAWPYHGPRFGLPLVPLVAVGAAGLVRVVIRRAGAQAFVGVAATAALVLWSYPTVEARGEAAARTLAAQHAAMDRLAAWHATTEAGELVSFDYREIARMLDRDVRPIGYTSDPAALWRQVEGADHLVVVELYRKRTEQVEILLATHPDRFTPLVDDGTLRVFAIRS